MHVMIFIFFPSLKHSYAGRNKRLQKLRLHYYTFEGNISRLSLTIFTKQPKCKIEVEVVLAKMKTPYSHFYPFLLSKPIGVTLG